MTDRRPVLIIFSDGTSEQIEPLSIAFFENLSRTAARQAEVYKQSPTSEQLLAMEYDVAWVASDIKKVIPELGCVLGKVGRWQEAYEAFQFASNNNPESASLMGNLGVAANAIGKYKESVEYFSKAQKNDADYFSNKPNQKKIFRTVGKSD